MARTNHVLQRSKGLCCRDNGILGRENVGTCLEIAQIVNDWRSKVVGGRDTAIFLWEACCIPSLLSGAGTWTEITTATEKKLNKLQCWYFKLVLQVSQGAPSASLLWDLAALDMSLRVY